MHPKEEITVIILKPDAVKRGLIGEIIKRIEDRGLKIVGLKMFQATRKQIDEHYPNTQEWLKKVGNKTLLTYEKYGYDPLIELKTKDPIEIGRLVRKWLIDFMTSGPMVKMAIQGVHAREMIRKLVGHTIPALAELGSIRGDFSVDSAILANRDKRAIHNLIHASETPEEQKHELEYWFSPDEIFNYKRADEDVMF